jgi:hypothetical protein
MQLAALVAAVQEFLVAAHDAVVIEDGVVSFDLTRAKYSLSSEHGKCVLHFWSAERNTVRRVVEAEIKGCNMRLAVLRMGQAKPSRMEIMRQRDPRTPTARKAARLAYQNRLQRMLERHFPDWRAARFTSAMDLGRSFSPVYTRGLLRRGQSAFALIGVNAQETQASVDAALTFGILWLDSCRMAANGKLCVEGLRVFVPAGMSEVVRERMAHLNSAAAKWQVYEVNEREESLVEVDCADRGNLATRLVHKTDDAATHERFAEAIATVRRIAPDTGVAVLSPAEIAFRCRGLEFARARLAEGTSFRSQTEIVFGIGAEETVLAPSNAEHFAERVQALAELRCPGGPRAHPLWRLHPERWLETRVLDDVSAVDQRLDPRVFYSQVPAFTRSDRAMMDVLSVARDGRLAVLELKAEEDLHLPLQGLDYWARVAWHHARGEFQRFGYFPGRELAAAAPLLLLVAPALHVHPATDALLRYLSPEIEWMLAGIDEHWRDGVRVVFRKRAERMERAPLEGKRIPVLEAMHAAVS